MKSAPSLKETEAGTLKSYWNHMVMPSRVLDILLKYKYLCWTSLILTDILLHTVAINRITPTAGEMEWELGTLMKG